MPDMAQGEISAVKPTIPKHREQCTQKEYITVSRKTNSNRDRVQEKTSPTQHTWQAYHRRAMQHSLQKGTLSRRVPSLRR